MNRFWDRRTVRIAAALVSGVLLYFTLGLTPYWFVAWVAPAPLLVAAFYAGVREARLLAWLAVAVGLSSNATYYWRVTGPVPTVVLTLLQILVWGFFVTRTRAAVTRTRAWWSVFVFPFLAAGADTLLGHFSPHGTWGSIAYTQMNALPMIQIASILGAPAIVFTVALIASTLAVALFLGRKIDRPILAYGLPILLVAASAGYGAVRLLSAAPESTVKVGLAAIDKYVAPPVPREEAKAVWARYDEIVRTLAGKGARIVLLPEKIDALDPAEAAARKHALSELAKTNSVDLVAGVQLDDPGTKYNASWLFDSSGNLLAEYHKQHLVPGLEGDLTPGRRCEVRAVNGARYGLVICRDMFFPALGRRYGRLGVSAMLDPAWDFGRDAWMESATAVLRGVESGYSVIRAGRDSYLNVSDRYGRIVARERSSGLPGSSIVAAVPLGPARPTLYARFGDVFGWLCALGALVCTVLPGWRRNRKTPGRQSEES